MIMGPKDETYTFSQVKELLKVHENTLLKVFNSTVERLGKKIDILKEEISKIKKELTDLRESVQYHRENVDEVTEKLENSTRVEEIKLDEITEDFVRKTKKKLADLEDRSRRNNLPFDGVRFRFSSSFRFSFKKKPMKHGRKAKAS